MGTMTLKGKIQQINPVKFVGENKTAIQTLHLFVPGFHDGFEKKGRDNLYDLQVLGNDKITSLAITPALQDKIIEVRLYVDSQYVEPKEPGQNGFFSVNFTIKDFTVVK